MLFLTQISHLSLRIHVLLNCPCYINEPGEYSTNNHHRIVSGFYLHQTWRIILTMFVLYLSVSVNAVATEGHMSVDAVATKDNMSVDTVATKDNMSVDTVATEGHISGF